MPRRIDIELTSALEDGSWTWRAAGARQPKGTLDGSLLPAGAAVGDELKVEVEQMLDGIDVLSVVRGRERSDAANLIELLPSDKPFEAVIETRARRPRREGRDGPRKGGRRNDRGDRNDRNDRGDRNDPGDRNDRGDRADRGDRSPRGDRGDRGERRRPHFEAPPELPQRPKPKRLRPGKTHRTEILESIAEDQRQIAELALQGLPAVRQRVRDENEKLKAAGQPEMPEASVLKMAEELLPKLRVADWLDRAEAAQRQLEHLDLRDLRSVVAAGDDPMVARDESTRVLAGELKEALAAKQEQEQRNWLEDIDAALGVGRVIRALRLSSQPPKAGAMFPPDLARRLGEATSTALAPDDSPDRWIAVLEAGAFSPIRSLITPASAPTTISDELKQTVLRLGPLLPQIAALLGVEIPSGTPTPKPLRPQLRKDQRKGGGDKRPAAPREPRTD